MDSITSEGEMHKNKYHKITVLQFFFKPKQNQLLMMMNIENELIFEVWSIFKQTKTVETILLNKSVYKILYKRIFKFIYFY